MTANQKHKGSESNPWKNNGAIIEFGEKSLHWKGGFKKVNGYIFKYCPEHPRAYNGRYVLTSRWLVEQYIGRYLLTEEEVHHINEIKDDDRLENFIAFASKSAHKRFHKNPDNVESDEIIFDGRTLVEEGAYA